MPKASSTPPPTPYYRRIVTFLVGLVIVPGVLLSAIGVLLLVLGEERFNLLLGILVLTFTGMLTTGVILVWVFLRREHALSELQADFVSKVSHELRTPLTSIRMFTETLALRPHDDETRNRCVAALEREGARLQQLIDRLLDWGRMEAGRRVYEFTPASLPELVHEAVMTFEPTRERRGVELSVDCDTPLTLTCDRAAVIDSLVNLLSNAYKYGGDPPKISLSTRIDGPFAEISVKDNGQGIARAEHKRIFDKFYRADDLLARKREGSGLGLAIVKHVIRAHRGKVVVDSSPGRGSTFTLRLPIDGPPS